MSPLISSLFQILILAIFFFLIIRPQHMREKRIIRFQESMREGMEVITNSGIIGRITKIDGSIVRLMVDEKTFIRLVKTAIKGEFAP